MSYTVLDLRYSISKYSEGFRGYTRLRKKNLENIVAEYKIPMLKHNV